MHMLDYDKKFLVKSLRQPDVRWLVDSRLYAQRESDLRLAIDWSGSIGFRRMFLARASAGVGE